MIKTLSEWLVGTCRRNICPTAKKASNTNVVNGGRTWARTKDPLIKRQQFSQCFQRLFRQIHDIPPVALPREAYICRNVSAPPESQLHAGFGRLRRTFAGLRKATAEHLVGRAAA